MIGRCLIKFNSLKSLSTDALGTGSTLQSDDMNAFFNSVSGGETILDEAKPANAGKTSRVTVLPGRTQRWIFASISLVLALVIGFVAIARDPPVRSVYDIYFGFGPAVLAILETHRFGAPDWDGGYWTYAHRLPLIPWLLSLLTVFFRSYDLVFLAKDSLCALLWVYTVLRLGRGPAQWYALLAFLYLVPSNGSVLSQINSEEPYLFFLLTALVAVVLTRARRDHWKLALLVAAIYLTKSSMGLVCGLGTLWVVWQDRKSGSLSLRSFAPAVGLLLAVMSWGGYIYYRTGVFAVGVYSSSWNGWNLYKGNNPRSLDMYPRINLDRLDDTKSLEPPASLNVQDEWTRNEWQLRMGKDFIRQHPDKVVAMDLKKLKVALFDIGPAPQHDPGRNLLASLSLAVDHAIFALAVFIALRRRDANALLFALFTLCYLAPYFTGFLYQRHMLPLYGVALIYGSVALSGGKRPDRAV